jgi:hypothetical protein
MEVRKIIHIFNDSGEIYTSNGWEIRCHPRNKNEQRIETRDTQEGTDHLAAYKKLKEDYKDEFYKYMTLHYEGGLFARYETNEEIPLKDIEELTTYCNARQISLFQCPSATIVGFVHHPQLMSMLSDDNFHPLSNLFKKTENTVGHKTLVTSLPLGSYLEKIRVPAKTNTVTVTVEKVQPVSAVDASALGVLSFTTAILGVVLGMVISRRS